MKGEVEGIQIETIGRQTLEDEKTKGAAPVSIAAQNKYCEEANHDIYVVYLVY